MEPIIELPVRFRLPAPRQRQLLEAMGDGCFVTHIRLQTRVQKSYFTDDGEEHTYFVKGIDNMAFNTALCGLLVRWPTKQRFRGRWKPVQESDGTISVYGRYESKPVPNDGPGWAVRWKRPDPQRKNREFFWWAQTDYGRACLRMLEAQEGRLELDRIESALLEGIRAGDPGVLNIYGDWLTENGIREPQVETWGRGVDFTPD